MAAINNATDTALTKSLETLGSFYEQMEHDLLKEALLERLQELGQSP